MRVQFLLAVGLPFFLASAPKDDAVKKEMAKLEGTWILVGGEEHGEALSEEEAKNEDETLIFKGNRIAKIRSGNKAEAEYRIDPAKKLGRLDLVYSAKERNHAIYSLDGDVLKICVSERYKPNSPKERPVRFTTKRSENKDLERLVLSIYKRKQ
jgi:uncharacterized protein (TIGR03067 family)